MVLTCVYRDSFYIYCRGKLYFICFQDYGDEMEPETMIQVAGSLLFCPEGELKEESFYRNAGSYAKRSRARLLWVSNPLEDCDRWNCKSVHFPDRTGVLKFGSYCLHSGTFSGISEKGLLFQGEISWENKKIRCTGDKLLLDWDGTLHFTVSVPEGYEVFSCLSAGIFYHIPSTQEKYRLNGWQRVLYTPVLHHTGSFILRACVTPYALFDNNLTYFTLPAGTYKSCILNQMGREVSLETENDSLHLVFEKRAAYLYYDRRLQRIRAHREYYLGFDGICRPSERKLMLGISAVEYAQHDGEIRFEPHCNGLLDENFDKMGTEYETTASWLRFCGQYYSTALTSAFFSADKQGDMRSFVQPAVRLAGESPAIPFFCWVENREEEDFVRETDRRLYAHRMELLSGTGNLRGRDEEPELLAVTVKGLMAGISGEGTWNWLGIAQTSGNLLPDIRLTHISDQLQRELMNREVFRVFHSAEEFRKEASVSERFSFAVDCWHMLMEPPMWREDTLLIFKYTQESSVAERLAEDEVFKEVYGRALEGDGSVRTGCGQFVTQMCSKSFTGVVLLNGKVSVRQMPPELSAIMQSVNQENMTVMYLVIKRNQIMGPKLSMEKSDVDALITYEDGQKIVNENKDIKEPDYRFKTTKLTVEIENSEVKNFSSVSELLINRLFGAAVERTDGDDGNCIIFNGKLQETDGQKGYCFSMEKKLRFYLRDSAVEQIRIIDASLDTGEDRSFFELSGEMFLKELEECDLLAYGGENGLGFQGFQLTMKEGDRLEADMGGLRFAAERSLMRKNSLPCQFDAKAEGFLLEETGLSPEDLGFDNISTPIRQGKLAGDWAGLVWRYSAGSSGQLGTNSLLYLDLLTAWGMNDGQLNYYIGLGREGVAGGMSLQGILGVGFSSVSLKKDTEGGYFFRMHQFSLKLLSLELPIGNADICLFARDGKTGWYAVYLNKKEDGERPEQEGEDI